MDSIIIKQFPNRDVGFFSIKIGNTDVYFGFDYPEIKKYYKENNLPDYLGRLAFLAISENGNKITLDKDCYFEFCNGEFEFLNYIPDWAKNVEKI